MGSELNWQRPSFQPGGGDAELLYVIPGRFGGQQLLDRTSYRTEGVPDGCVLEKFDRERHREMFHELLNPYGPMKAIQDKNRELWRRIEEAPECMVLSGAVRDPLSLNYLRDAIGVVTWLTDIGGVAVWDPALWHWWPASDWRRELFEPDRPQVHRHVVFFIETDFHDAAGEQFFRLKTRGLGKFGRPDLLLSRLRPEWRAGAVDLASTLIAAMAGGLRLEDGQPLEAEGIPGLGVCRRTRGSLGPFRRNGQDVLEITWNPLKKGL